jgi:hypothetical protein
MVSKLAKRSLKNSKKRSIYKEAKRSKEAREAKNH